MAMMGISLSILDFPLTGNNLSSLFVAHEWKVIDFSVKSMSNFKSKTEGAIFRNYMEKCISCRIFS